MLSCSLVDLPDSILLNILFHVDRYQDILNVSSTCRKLNRVAADELLWKQLFIKDFKFDEAIKKKDDNLWIDEYRRLKDEVPVVESECISDHVDQVLHVSFSHDGSMFCTTSKDGTFVVWSSEYPCKDLYYKNMRNLGWHHTQSSKFNDTDELLLVSGVFSETFRTSGEIAIFSLEEDELRLQCRASNKPYDAYGDWFNTNHFISVEMLYLGDLLSASILWVNRASQEIQSEHTAVVSRLCQFYQENASCVRTLTVADVNEKNTTDILDVTSEQTDTKPGKMDIDDSDTEIDYEENRDKLLIFTTGSRTYPPHEIGVRRMRNVKIPKNIHFNHNITELVRKHKQELHRAHHSVENQAPEQLRNTFDGLDFRIDCESHIIGMCLSPDQKYLYVNLRAWTTEFVHPRVSPKPSPDVKIYVYDLKTMEKMDSCYVGHKALSGISDCAFLFPSASQDYIVSGSEDSRACIWDRHFTKCMASLPHEGVVNAVAFNPADQEMFVSVSDDSKVRVFRSFRRVRELGQSWKGLKVGTLSCS